MESFLQSLPSDQVRINSRYNRYTRTYTYSYEWYGDSQRQKLSSWRSSIWDRYDIRRYTNRTYKKIAGRWRRVYMPYRRINRLGDKPAQMKFSFVNTFEQGGDTYRRNERKYMQQFVFSIHKDKLADTRALSHVSSSELEVPDHFDIGGTIRMKVGETKTLNMGTRGGSYRYRKTNHNI